MWAIYSWLSRCFQKHQSRTTQRTHLKTCPKPLEPLQAKLGSGWGINWSRRGGEKDETPQQRTYQAWYFQGPNNTPPKCYGFGKKSSHPLFSPHGMSEF